MNTSDEPSKTAVATNVALDMGEKLLKTATYCDNFDAKMEAAQQLSDWLSLNATARRVAEMEGVLSEVMNFIAREYYSETAIALEGEHLAKEARGIHTKICNVLFAAPSEQPEEVR